MFINTKRNVFKKCSSYCLRRHSYLFDQDRQVRNLFSHEYANNYNESADGVKSIGARYREEWRHVV